MKMNESVVLRSIVRRPSFASSFARDKLAVASYKGQTVGPFERSTLELSCTIDPHDIPTPTKR
jgi:hypothetical protein